MGSDQRIGDRFLRAGPAYGGSCFPKDTRAIIDTSNKFKSNLSIIKAVIKSNEDRKKLLTEKVYKILNNNLKNKLITFLLSSFMKKIPYITPELPQHINLRKHHP